MWMCHRMRKTQFSSQGNHKTSELNEKLGWGQLRWWALGQPGGRAGTSKPSYAQGFHDSIWDFTQARKQSLSSPLPGQGNCSHTRHGLTQKLNPWLEGKTFVAKPSRHVMWNRVRNIFITVLDVWGFLMTPKDLLKSHTFLAAPRCNCCYMY